ncbi:MAG TPA: YchJ family metal-binding protein [Glaciihabitans sp.]|nr:YchJ family metal-binding protein [Glaciihabitans sp.]
MDSSPTPAWPQIADEARCPCLSGDTYGLCCAPLHRGDPAPSAERLMRSRYSAFVLGLADYLLDTWHPTTRPESLQLDSGIRWFRLDILSRRNGILPHSRGEVEFSAHFRDGSDVGTQHEVSEFLKQDGRWFYVASV